MKYGNVTLGRVEAVWNKLGGEEGVQKFLSGLTEIVPMERIIDCDKEPFLITGWKIEDHLKCGKITWDASRVHLYRSDNQRPGRSITGVRLRKELSNKAVLNASVLEYLLKNPHLIPEEWKDLKVYFWGTIFHYEEPFVQYLCWVCGWTSGTTRLKEVWHVNRPAAVFTS